LNCGVGFLYKSALIFVKPEASAIRRDAFSPAIRFAHKLTKKQTRLQALRQNSMLVYIRIHAWQKIIQGRRRAFFARMTIMTGATGGQAPGLMSEISSQVILTQSHSY
jgi:hypothetical protein